MRATCSSITASAVHVAGASAGVGRGSSSACPVPRGVCSDLGMELHGVEAALGILHRRDRRGRRRGRDAEARRAARTTASLWLIQHVSTSPTSWSSTRRRGTVERRLAELGGARARDLAAERARHAPACRSRCPAPGSRARARPGRAAARPARRPTPGRRRGSIAARVARAHAPRAACRAARARSTRGTRARGGRSAARTARRSRARARAAVLARARRRDSSRRRAHRAIPTPCSRCSFLPSVCSAGANMISAFWNSWIVS